MKKFLSALVTFGVSYVVCTVAESSNSSQALKSKLKENVDLPKKMGSELNKGIEASEKSGPVLNEDTKTPENKDTITSVWDLMPELKNREKMEEYVRDTMVEMLRDSKIYKETIEYINNYAKLFMKLYESGENEEQWEKIDASEFMKKIDVSVAKKCFYILFTIPKNVYEATYKLWEQDTRKIPEVYKMRNLMGGDWGKHFSGVYSQEGTEKGKRLSDFFVRKLKLI